MHLQLSRLSETFLRFCIFTPHECPGVTQIVPFFHFWIHRPERTTRPSGSILVLCVCVPKLRSCCAATMSDSFVLFWFFFHSPDCELEFCLIEGFVPDSASNFIWLVPVLHLDLIWTAAHCPSLLTCRPPPSVLSGHSASSHALGIKPSCPLYLSTHLLGLCESLALRGRASLFLETCHRPRYDGSGTESIVGTPIEYLRPFTNEVWQGFRARSHRRAAGCIRQRILRWNN